MLCSQIDLECSISCILHVFFMLYYLCSLQCNDAMAWTNHKQVWALWRALEEEEQQDQAVQIKQGATAVLLWELQLAHSKLPSFALR